MPLAQPRLRPRHGHSFASARFTVNDYIDRFAVTPVQVIHKALRHSLRTVPDAPPEHGQLLEFCVTKLL
mgnify:CR=1 FL=1